MPELKPGVLLSKFFYHNNPARNFILKKYGQHFSNLMVDILHGDKPFPTNVSEKLKTKIKEKIF